ncbi:MAG TPA: methyltransferase domain-containing protein [Terriglobales bacterium]|nr:methyltransferase domain-containing protein [Terriglobales bacterium]
MADSLVKERNQAEIRRSASEASKLRLAAIPGSNLDRYLDPPANTPYPLEYAFHLLGDARGKTVLDLGCGMGENIVPLVLRGAQVTGIDISPDLIAIAQQRLRNANLEATLRSGDAYATGLPDESVDVIFCMALIHHLDLNLVREEMRRILRKGGSIILREPIRFSQTYARLRQFLPAHDDISEYEHPLTRTELVFMTASFRAHGARYFRLPFVPLVSHVFPSNRHASWKASNWILRHWPAAQHYATAIVVRLEKDAA